MPPKIYPMELSPEDNSPYWTTTFLDGEYCETLREYSPGGLCPVLIDDILSGQDLVHEGRRCSFRIIGKLGHGAYSTVWLSRNKESGKFFALKALRQEHSIPKNSELRILKKLGKLRYAFFYTHVPTQNKFLFLATDPLGCTLRDREHADIDVPADLSSITIFVKTLLQKLHAMHKKGIHHGDISPSNVAMGVDEDAFTNEALQETFKDDMKSPMQLIGVTEAERELSPRPANLPEYIMRHHSPLLTNSFDMSLVDFMDFGEAFDTPSKANVHNTILYDAPEAVDPKNISTAKSDLWSLGCVIAYGLSDTHLFYMDQDREKYANGTTETQLLMIDRLLQGHLCLESCPKYRGVVVRIVHSLVKPDPTERDLGKAMKLLLELERHEDEDIPYFNS